MLADKVTYDDTNNIVEAIGNVEIAQSGRILRASKITYEIDQDKVKATGDVVLNEDTGDVYFADALLLTDEMKNGFVEGLQGVLADGSRFSAEEAEKIDDLKIILKQASYTACEACEVNPYKAPAWQINADQVTHHKDEQRISYQNATFELGGVPVAYMPYFSHPDGTVDRKSGFLTPSVGFDSDLGAFYEQEYYWNIAPDKDATVGTKVMTNQNPLLLAEYRQRFDNAQITLDGGVTYAERDDISGGVTTKKEEEVRGHFFVDGLWNINEKWRAGTEIEYVSDDQYLREYDLSSNDVLENKVYAERFSGRNYGLGRLIRFKDIRVSNRAEDQPNIFPEVYTKFVGSPNDVLGGRYDVEFSALNLAREGGDQDLTRATAKGGWERRMVTRFGLVNDIDLNLRGDVYRADDRDVAVLAPNRSSDSTAIRGFANIQYKASMPFEKQINDAQIVLEPIVAVTGATDVDADDSSIPNEDSQDAFLDTTNLFNANRFPGYDRIEDESNATYGVRTGWFNNNGHEAELFLGQSYRFDSEATPFPEGSGLSEQRSDFVGSVSASFGERFYMNYETRLGNNNLASKRHELDVAGRLGKWFLGTRYFYANALQGTDLTEDREQIQTFAKYQINDEWSVYSAIQYDIAQETEGLRRFNYGVDYEGQCFTIGLHGERKLTRDVTG
ncbi:MAG: LPS assembly protein LptD, partial [Pseudomonadota bacterium]